MVLEGVMRMIFTDLSPHRKGLPKRQSVDTLAGPAAIGFAALLAISTLGSAPKLPAQLGQQLNPGLTAAVVAAPAAPDAVFADPTYSSPIALSQDGKYVWSVNPDDDSVSVIRTLDDVEVARVRVGDEPQSVALDPNNNYAYVANAADSSVSIIQVTQGVTFNPTFIDDIVTGAEPWNIVVSPDGKRVFVANSVQDTITILKSDVASPVKPTVLGSVNLNSSACNADNPNRHFQPRGLAVSADNAKLLVTRFISFVKIGGTQATDGGKEGLVCRFDVNTAGADAATSLTNPAAIKLAATVTGFKIDSNGDTVPDDTSAYPNQMQSVVLRGGNAYLPSIAASPSGPLKFNVDTEAYVNQINNYAAAPVDGGALNLHLGARVPETGKTKIFFANVWAMAFTSQSGAGNAYVVSSASDVLVKLNVDAGGVLAFTGGVSTTRYIDLNANNSVDANTFGRNAGKNPLGIVIKDGTKAYVMNRLSRNISVVDLTTDSVIKSIATGSLPFPSSKDEQIHVGAEVFFSSRGHFDKPAGTTVSTDDRLSSEGWQSCASCHFNGWTDGEVWSFNAGPRKSVPLNGTWSPHNPDDQRLLNYSAIFDEVQDFELNIRNVSGPGNLAAPINGSLFDPNHGLLISDTGDINSAPAIINAFVKPNAGRPQHTVTLPASTTKWGALDAVKEWVRFAIRTPNGALTDAQITVANGGLLTTDVRDGRRLFFQAGCAQCHAGPKWTTSRKDFAAPPGAAEINTETVPTPTLPGTAPIGAQYLNRFLSDIKSFNLNVAGAGNLIAGTFEATNAIGGIEKTQDKKDALGIDYNGDGKGVGFNVPSLLGIWHLPPYYHNGACETLACVLANPVHRTAKLRQGQSDPLVSATNQAKVVTWLKTLDADTEFPINLSINSHNVFFDPPTIFAGSQVTVGGNIQLFGNKSDLIDVINGLGITGTLKVKITFTPPGGPAQSTDVVIQPDLFTGNFGTLSVSAVFNAGSSIGQGRVDLEIDPTDLLPESAGGQENDNKAGRRFRVRTAPSDNTPPQVSQVIISDDNPFNDADAIVQSPNVKIKFTAIDPAGSNGATPSGAKEFCVVRYFYDVPERRWVETDCTFKALPAATSPDTFIVDETIPNFEGTAYAFVWIKDGAGNISRTPGFDAVSYIPAREININRNDVRLFRLSVPANTALTFDVAVNSGDVDVSAFDGVGDNATRVDVSAQIGAVTETVQVSNPTGATKLFQIEVRAIVNSRIQIAVTQGPALALSTRAERVLLAPTREEASSKPLIAGPPALRTAIGADNDVFVPTTLR